jgi:hypothetical protein
MQGMSARRVTPRPPERPQQAPVVDLMGSSVIQAEIARQVALYRREERYPVGKVQTGPRLVVFPGKGRDSA